MNLSQAYTFIRYTYFKDSYLAQLSQTNEAMVAIELGRKKLWCPLDIELIQHVLVKEPQYYSKKTLGYERLTKIIGLGMVTQEGEKWKNSRTAVARYFTQKNINTAALQEHIDYWVERHLEKSVITDLQQNLTLFSLELFLLGVLGKEYLSFAQPLVAPLNYLFKTLDRFHRFPFPRYIEWSTREKSLYQIHHSELLKVIRLLIEHSSSSEGIIPSLKQAGLSVDEIVGELQNMLVAGHETTANALSFLLAELARDLNVQKRIAQGDKELLRSTILESFRLYPAIANFGRQVTVPHRLGSYEMQVGDSLMLSPFVLGRRAEYFPHPLEFRPERFLTHDVRKDVLFPFGLGERTCLGKQLAQIEMERVVESLLKSCTLHLSEELSGPIKASFCVSLRPLKKISLTLRSRR